MGRKMLVLETWNPHHGVDNSGYLDMEAFMNLIWGMSVKGDFSDVESCASLVHG